MRSEVAPAPSPPQLAALWLAGAFISLAGFGLVQYVDSLTPWIPGPESVVSGLFHTPLAHAVVHLALGAAALLAAGSTRTCVVFLAAVGGAMLMLVGYGLLDNSPALSSLVPGQGADAWLHLVLVIGAIGAACLTALPRRLVSS